MSRYITRELVSDVVFFLALGLGFFLVAAIVAQSARIIGETPFGGALVNNPIAVPLGVGLLSALVGGAAKLVTGPTKDLRRDFEDFRKETNQAHDRLARRVDQHLGKEDGE